MTWPVIVVALLVAVMAVYTVLLVRSWRVIDPIGRAAGIGVPIMQAGETALLILAYSSGAPASTKVLFLLAPAASALVLLALALRRRRPPAPSPA